MWEKTSAYIANENGWLSIWNSSYAVATANNNTNKISTKYATVYKHNTTYDNTGKQISDPNRQTASQYNRAENINIYGDAMVETSNGSWGETSWQGDFSYFLSLDGPTVIRGGKWSDVVCNGVFAFTRHDGAPHYFISSRAVVVAL